MYFSALCLSKPVAKQHKNKRKPRKILRVPEARTFVEFCYRIFLQILPTEREGKEGQRLERKAKNCIFLNEICLN